MITSNDFFMPQMSPMLWMILAFFNFFSLFMVMIYLNSMPIYLMIKDNNNNMSKNYINNLKWEWMW